MKKIVANLKMNFDLDEIIEYKKKLDRLDNKGCLIIAPPNIYFDKFLDYTLCAQDVSRFKNGSFTGDISASQLKSMNVKYAIVGHSERRYYYQESESNYLEKINNLLDESIIPIYCIGETKEELERNKTYYVLERQVTRIMNFLSNKDQKKIIIAYEPRWAIGTGVTPSMDDIDVIIRFIKKLIISYYEVNIEAYYGGSINNDNIDDILQIDSIDGLLIGSTSIKIEELKEIIKKCRE